MDDVSGSLPDIIKNGGAPFIIMILALVSYLLLAFINITLFSHISVLICLFTTLGTGYLQLGILSKARTHRKNRMSILMTLGTAGVIITVFAVHYYIDGNVCGESGCTKDDMPTSLYFSMITFSTTGYGDYAPIGYMRFYASIEAFIGMLLMLMLAVQIGSAAVSPSK